MSSTYGLGSVRQRPDGRWEWRAPPSFGRKTLYAKTRKEALAKARAWVASKPEAPTSAVENRTVKEAVEAFLASCEERVRANTRAQYRSLLRTHVVPRRGELPIGKVGRDDIERLYARLDDAGVSVSTRQAIHIALRQVFRFAIDRGWVEVDPMDKVKRPGGSRRARVKTGKVQHWSEDELRRLLFVARETLPPVHALACEVLAGTGARVSEVLGLTFRDHDAKRKTLRIERSFSKGREIEALKSETSRRTVQITPELSAAIEAERDRREARPDDHIFATRTGVPIDQDRLRRILRGVAREAEVPELGPHALRHTHAVILIERGTSPRVVQLRLGHADVGTTLGMYGHATAAMQDQAVAELGRVFGG
jgi:integrase